VNILRDLVAAGYSDAQIADRIGVSARSVRRWRRRDGLRSQWAPQDPQHGTRSRYNKGCRCDPCKEANSAYSAHVRAVYGTVRYPRQEAPTSR
jgi:uncharacterized protein YjcR